MAAKYRHRQRLQVTVRPARAKVHRLQLLQRYVYQRRVRHTFSSTGANNTVPEVFRVDERERPPTLTHFTASTLTSSSFTLTPFAFAATTVAVPATTSARL